jgi:hypothetical protein
VKEAYDLTRWRTHLKTCLTKPTKKASNTITLFSMGSWKLGRESAVETKAATAVENLKPCPGLSEDNDEKIPEYLQRTTASGGGSKRVHNIAKDMFGRLFKALEAGDKEQVLQYQAHGQRWRNDHRSLRVYSTSCEKSVNKRGNRILPCSECASLLNLKAFREVLRKPTPKPKNQIYTNKLHRLPVLGAIYAKHIGLKDIIETPVRTIFYVNSLQGLLIYRNINIRMQKIPRVFVTPLESYLENIMTKCLMAFLKPWFRNTTVKIAALDYKILNTLQLGTNSVTS